MGGMDVWLQASDRDHSFAYHFFRSFLGEGIPYSPYSLYSPYLNQSKNTAGSKVQGLSILDFRFRITTSLGIGCKV